MMDDISYLVTGFKNAYELPFGSIGGPKGYRQVKVPLTKQQRIKRARCKRARKARRIHRRAAK